MKVFNKLIKMIAEGHKNVSMEHKYIHFFYHIFKHGLLIISIFLLNGCMDVATTGAQAIYNHQSLKKNFDDQYENFKAYQALYVKTDEFKNANISVSTYNGKLLLAGQVPESWQRRKALKIIKEVSDVKEVYNLITVSSPSSALTRISDSWITTKIKAKLLASTELDATKIKVVTENGTVYLMGIIPVDEAKLATDLASNTDGVQRVVRVFSYLKITKHPV